MNAKIALIAAAALLCAHCTKAPKKAANVDIEMATSKSTTAVAESAFDRGLSALESERYAEAAAIFDRLLVTKPADERDLATLFNAGAAHEGLGNCPAAAERYRKVARSSAGKFRRLEAMAFMRLSLMYECMGQDTKAIAALLDARKRKDELTQEARDAELPARLAAAYARVGNRPKAMAYFNLASKGLKKVLANSPSRRKSELMGKTLFMMGQLTPAQRLARVDSATYLQSLSIQQPYLLQAIEMNHAAWSRKAADDLATAYENIFKFKIEDESKRRAFYTRGLQTVAEIRRIRLPESGQLVDQVFIVIDRVHARLQTELANVPETTSLTPEAKKREGLKREGRAVNP